MLIRLYTPLLLWIVKDFFFVIVERYCVGRVVCKEKKCDIFISEIGCREVGCCFWAYPECVTQVYEIE
jgi:hypothetical protein